MKNLQKDIDRFLSQIKTQPKREKTLKESPPGELGKKIEKFKQRLI